MKKSLLLFVMFLSISVLGYSQNTDLFNYFNKVDKFLRKNVKNGLVDYKGIHNDKSELEELIKLSNTLNVSENNTNTYKAFWINNYNISVIDFIVENYPITSPMEVTGFFNTKKIRMGNKKVTLKYLEDEMLRKQFPDARYHFALVCGAVSCPPITNYAYLPQILENQLNKQTILAMDNIDFLKIDNTAKTAQLSEIFKWYKKDFLAESKSLLDYINKYKTTKIPANYKQSYYTYNWSVNQLLATDNIGEAKKISNIKTFTPSSLLKKGQWDFKLFNNLYTQTKQADADGKSFKTGYRESFMTSTLEVTHGITKNGRINVGAVIGLRSSSKTVSGLSNVFSYKNENSSDSTFLRSGFTSFAPIIKVSPFKNVSNFSFQTSLSIPLFKDITYGYFDKKSYVWDTKFFYDYSFGDDKFQTFAELDLNYSFGENSEDVKDDITKNAGERFANNSLGVPVSLFLSYFPSDKFTVYINGQHYWLIDLGNNYSQNFTQVGFGLKYQATSKLNIELSHGQFVRGANFAGLGQTYNLGLRYIL